MSRNYPYESGSFRALTKMFTAAARELGAATTDHHRQQAMKQLDRLARQTDQVLKEFGYAEPMPKPRVNIDGDV
jgi:hypothetical protein